MINQYFIFIISDKLWILLTDANAFIFDMMLYLDPYNAYVVWQHVEIFYCRATFNPISIEHDQKLIKFL